MSTPRSHGNGAARMIAASCAQFLHAVVPEHTDETVGKGVEIYVEFAFCNRDERNPLIESMLRTFNVILRVRVCRLVVVYHLHDLQEIFFAQAL